MLKIAIIIFNILLFYGIGFCADVKAPIVKESKIIFDQGKVVNYYPKKVLFSDPLEASKQKKPVSISEEVFVSNKWMKVILIRYNHYYEDKTVSIEIYNFNGDLLNKTKEYLGRVEILEKTNRILFCQISAHHLAKESYLLNENGAAVSEIKQLQNTFDYGYSNDNKIIWLFSNHLKNGKPYLNVKIFDFNGKFIDSVKSFGSKKIKVNYENRAYYINIPQPKVPG